MSPANGCGRGVAQPGRAPVSGAGGRWFESSPPDHRLPQKPSLMSQSLLEIKPSLRLDLGNGVYLRPISEADVTREYVEGLNNPEVNRYLAVRNRRQTHHTARAYVRANAADPGAILFGIYSGNVLNGTLRLHDMDRRNSQATIGIALFDRDFSGR